MVKPVNLMRHLVRLVTPPGGVVLDPFNGSGTTGIAAMLEGMQYIGCEQDPHYLAITRARMRSKRWVREAERLRHLREQGVFWEPERSKDKPALVASNHREPKPKHARPEGLWKEGEP